MTLPMIEGVSRPLSHHGGVDRAPWSIVSEELRIETPFATFYVEELVDDQERRYEWARIEKPDSLLLLIEDNGDLLLPPPAFRPGIGAWSQDLPGGRLEGPDGIAGAASRIAARELGIPLNGLVDIDLITRTGWAIDSSTSSARLHVASARLGTGSTPSSEVRRHRASPSGIAALLDELDCLQCRAALEAWRQSL